MKVNRIILVVIVIIVILIMGLFIWRSEFFGTKKVTPAGEITAQTKVLEGTNNQITEKIEDFGKLTDDIYVDMLVQVMSYQAEKNPNTYALNLKNLYEKYGVTEERMKAYTDELDKDPVRAQAIVQKYTQRLAELQK